MTSADNFASRYTPPTEAQKDKEIEEALQELEDGFEIVETSLTLSVEQFVDRK